MEGLRERASNWIRRVRQVAGILTRFGFGSFVQLLALDRLLPRRWRPAEGTAGMDPAVRLRMALEELGPTAIKLGQALSSRADVVPVDFARELRRLQDEVPPVPFDQARQVVQEELDGALEDLFEEFDETPVASASLSQVHRGVLSSGETVAVKVQRPEIEKQVETDLQILVWAARRAEQYSQWCQRNNLADFADEFAHTLRQELNFVTEATNTERLATNLAGDERVIVPRVHWSLTNRRALTLEWIEGIKVDEVEELREAGVDCPQVARELGESILRQIFEDGYFHADPHPGNVHILPDGTIAFLDCGNAGYLGKHMRDAFIRLLLAVVGEDAAAVCDHLIAIGTISDETNLQDLQADTEKLIGRYGRLRSSQGMLTEMFDQMMALTLRHRVRMPANFPQLVRALVVTEGVCLTLDPDFDSREAANKIADAILREWLSPARLADEVVRAVREVRRYGMQLPRQISHLFSQTLAGGLRTKVEYVGLERPMHRLDVMVNRIAFAMVVAAIIVSSAVMFSSETVTQIIGTPLSVAYVVIGVLMGGWLVYSILRSGRL